MTRNNELTPHGAPGSVGGVGWFVVAYLPGSKRMVGEESGVFLGLVVYSK